MAFIEKIIDRFDLGMVNDPREENTRYSQLVRGFDIHTSPKRIVPFRNSESGDVNGDTSRKQNFCIALRTGTTYSLFALGQRSSSDGRAEILYKDLTQGSDNDLDDNAWTNTTNYQSTSDLQVDFELFVYYRKTNLIYAARDGTNLLTYSPAGSGFTDSARTFNYTEMGQGLVHSKDDILYIPYYNANGAAGSRSFILSNNNGTWNNTALTLPDHYIPTSICEYGNYLAIACRHTDQLSSSRVYLWDRNSSLTDVSESLDFGQGNLYVLEELDGKLVGISTQGVVSGSSTLAYFFGELIIRVYEGGTPYILRRFVSTGNAVTVSTFKQKINSFLYFTCSIDLNSVTHQGIWKIGRSRPDQPFSISFDRTPDNDTALTAGTIRGFFLAGNFMFISYSSGTPTAVYALSKTNDTNTFTSSTSIYESQILNLGDSSRTKKLIGVTVFYEALPSAGSVLLSYKKDEETSFTTIFTDSVDNSISHSSVNIESTGVTLPEYKEITFRIESSGGAVITGLRYKVEIIDNDVY